MAMHHLFDDGFVVGVGHDGEGPAVLLDRADFACPVLSAIFGPGVDGQQPLQRLFLGLFGVLQGLVPGLNQLLEGFLHLGHVAS